MFCNNFFGVKKIIIKRNPFFGISFRLVLFFAYPWLSEDFYRFIWDGFVIGENINPYEYTPSELINNEEILETKKILRNYMEK